LISGKKRFKGDKNLSMRKNYQEVFALFPNSKEHGKIKVFLPEASDVIYFVQHSKR
jgi:hypothetical protein